MLIWAAIVVVSVILLWKIKKMCFSSKRKRIISNRNSGFRSTDGSISNRMSTPTYDPIQSVSSLGNNDCQVQIASQNDVIMSTNEVEALRSCPNFMTNPVAALQEVGASNAEIARVLKQLSIPSKKPREFQRDWKMDIEPTLDARDIHVNN